MIKKVNNNIFYLNSETKTINTLKKTIILEKQSKYDSLDFSIILDTIVNRTKQYNKVEFKKVKALNYNLNFKASFKEVDNNILLVFTIEFLSYNFIDNPESITKLINDILGELVITEDDLDLIITDYKQLYSQLKDMNDQYTKYLLKDEIYIDDEEVLKYAQSEEYLKRVKPLDLINKFDNIDKENYYYIIEGSNKTFEVISKQLKVEDSSIKVYTKYNKKVSNSFKKVEELKNESQVAIALSYQKEINKIEEEYLIRTFNYMLGRGTFSLLFKNVREKESLCYSIYSQEDLNYGINVFTGVEYKNIDKALEKIEEQFEIIRLGNCEEELAKSKEKYIADLLQVNKKLYFQELLIQKNLIYQTSEYQTENIIDKIKDVKLEDIQKVSKDLKLTKVILKN